MVVEKNEIGYYIVENSNKYYLHSCVHEKFGAFGLTEACFILSKIASNYVIRVTKLSTTVPCLPLKKRSAKCVYFIHEDLVPILVRALVTLGVNERDKQLEELFGTNNQEIVISKK